MSFVLPILIFSLGLMAFVATQKMAKTQVKKQSIVEQESESLIIIEMDISGPNATRIPFSTITSLEYVIGGDSNLYELFIIDGQFKKTLIFSTNETILKRAEYMAEVMNKQLILTNNTRLQQ